MSMLKARPLYVALAPGQQHDSTVAEELIAHARGHVLIADTAYDADRITAAVRAQGMKPVLCTNPTRKYNRRQLDRALHGQRYRVAQFFHKLKRLRVVGTRYETVRATLHEPVEPERYGN